jgi:histidyl-tRNA synthetase
VGKDLRAADHARAGFAVIVGPEEWSTGEVIFKNLKSGEQKRLSVENLAEAIQSESTL